jgi:hypothetical protein
MADSYIQMPADSTGKKVDTEQLTVGANTVERERVQITGTAAAEIAPVSATDGLLVNLGANNDVTITSGTVTVGAALPAGTNNIGDVDVLTLPALPAGTNNIGDVDVLTLPALPAGTNNIGDVDIASIAAGTNNIGDVDVASIAAGATLIGSVSLDIDPSDAGTLQATKFAVIDVASSGDNTIITAVGGKQFRILSYVLVASGGANTLTFKSAATALTGGMGLASTGGVSAESMYGLMQGGTNENFILNLSAATSVDGHIAYIEV